MNKQKNVMRTLLSAAVAMLAVVAWAEIRPQVPVGTIHDFAGDVAPTGFLACDGTAVSRTSYAALYAVIGTKFGAGDGKNTFNLPDFSNAFAEGAAKGDKVGTNRSPGLPDFGGRRRWMMGDGSSGMTEQGAFYGAEHGRNRGWNGQDGNEMYDSNFLASKGELHGDEYRNDVYGKSDTVQPKSVVVLKVIKY